MGDRDNERDTGPGKGREEEGDEGTPMGNRGGPDTFEGVPRGDGTSRAN